jgi:hypothetical protein
MRLPIKPAYRINVNKIKNRSSTGRQRNTWKIGKVVLLKHCVCCEDACGLEGKASGVMYLGTGLEWSASRYGCFAYGGRAPGAHWVGG